MSHANGPVPISQVAMVVRDREASMNALHETLDWWLDEPGSGHAIELVSSRAHPPS